MNGISREDLALSEIKAEFDSALIQLETKLNLPHGNEYLTQAREAGDKLFGASLKRKFNSLLDERPSYVELIEEGYWSGRISR